ncbi:MAG: peptidyl-prolyl cis-trans isomerase [Lachnospiraceae bacterium]|nr:peptidyl-prolyl cis-trans isomerase [Lachnospiraceae bacterium]
MKFAGRFALIFIISFAAFITGCGHPLFDSTGYGLSAETEAESLTDIVSHDEPAEKTRVVLTMGFSKDEVFRIENISCSLPEVMVYLTNIQNSYEETFGSEIWDVVSDDGETLEESIKDNALSRIARVKTMVLMSESLGLSLSGEQMAAAEEAAKKYYDSLTDYEIYLMGVDEDTIRSMCVDYATAQSLYRYLINDINPEISDDEARTVKIDSVFMDSGDPESYKIMSSILSAINNDVAFDTAALESGRAVQQVISLNKTDTNVDPKLLNKAFNMSEGEVSGIIETEDGYFIIKCLSTLDREETDENKEKIVRNKRQEAFGREYDAFSEKLTRRLNERLWDNTDLIHDPGCKTTSFFTILEEYTGEED